MNIDVLKKAMARQIVNPARAVVNGESSFVRCNVAMEGEVELARQYWSWVCSGYQSGRNPDWVDDDILQMQDDLDAIDKTCIMPSWGTYGT